METGHFWQIITIGAFQVYVEQLGDHYVATVASGPDRHVVAEGCTVFELREKLVNLLAEKTPPLDTTEDVPRT